MKRKITLSMVIVMILLITIFATGCYNDDGNREDTRNTLEIGSRLASNQPTPTDLDYSLERYNLIRRAYWVNGQREKAINLPCPIVE